MVKHRHKITEEDVKKGRMDFLLFTITMMLSIFGVIMVFDSSVNLLANKYHFVILQSLWVVVGTIAMLVISMYDYKKLAKLALPLMFFSVVSLILVLLIG